MIIMTPPYVKSSSLKRLLGCVQIILVSSTVVLSGAAHAAEFEFLTGAAEPVEGNSFVRTQCNLRMTGEIVTGDAARFQDLIEAVSSEIEKDRSILGNPRIAVLCMDSQGGSLDEAIKMAELIRSDRNWREPSPPFISTRLEANSTCESACAIVFLAGTFDDWEGSATVSRSMHPTARLGVHAPALALPAGQYDETTVSLAYDVSVRAIAETLRVLNVGTASDGSPYSGAGAWMKASMLEAMLQTPSQSMRYVETVNDAGRWGITVHPIAPVTPTPDGLYYACFNRDAWRRDQPSIPYGDSNPAAQDLQNNVYGLAERERYVFSLDELNGWNCEAVIFEDLTYSIAADSFVDQEVPGSQLELLDPTTPIASLAVPGEQIAAPATLESRTYWVAPSIETSEDFAAAEAPAILQGSDWGPRYGGNRISYWDHNGSGMAWEQRDEVLWIWYYAPRPGLIEAGVLPGSLLFYSTENYRSTGVARRFSSRCDDVIYEVEKTSLETHRHVFEGTYHRLTEDCSLGEVRPDRLVFDFISQSPDAISLTPDGSAPDDLMRIIGVNSTLNFRAGPSANSERIAELPANLTNIQLLSCRPLLQPGLWHNGSPQQRRDLMDERWCSLEYGGEVGFVSGRYLGFD